MVATAHANGAIGMGGDHNLQFNPRHLHKWHVARECVPYWHRAVALQLMDSPPLLEPDLAWTIPDTVG